MLSGERSLPRTGEQGGLSSSMVFLAHLVHAGPPVLSGAQLKPEGWFRGLLHPGMRRPVGALWGWLASWRVLPLQIWVYSWCAKTRRACVGDTGQGPLGANNRSQL